MPTQRPLLVRNCSWRARLRVMPRRGGHHATPLSVVDGSGYNLKPSQRRQLEEERRQLESGVARAQRVRSYGSRRDTVAFHLAEGVAQGLRARRLAAQLQQEQQAGTQTVDPEYARKVRIVEAQAAALDARAAQLPVGLIKDAASAAKEMVARHRAARAAAA